MRKSFFVVIMAVLLMGCGKQADNEFNIEGMLEDAGAEDIRFLASDQQGIVRIYCVYQGYQVVLDTQYSEEQRDAKCRLVVSDDQAVYMPQMDFIKTEFFGKNTEPDGAFDDGRIEIGGKDFVKSKNNRFFTSKEILRDTKRLVQAGKLGSCPFDGIMDHYVISGEDVVLYDEEHNQIEVMPENFKQQFLD